MIPTAQRIQYATGYIALGLLREAEAELEAIVSDERDSPEVLVAHTELAMAVKRWGDVVRFGRRLTELEPDNLQGWVWWAYALRELQEIREARSVLLRIDASHGDTHAVVPYNLACYYCLLGELDEARRYFAKACKLDPSFKESAAADRDLDGLRPYPSKP